MIAPNCTERHMIPVDPAEQVSQEMQSAAVGFYRNLFSRERMPDGNYTDNLGGIVAEDFQQDDHPDAVYDEGHVAVSGLTGLRAYRATFDVDGNPPELVGLETTAVPASETWNIPGTNERYDFGAVLQFTVKGPRGQNFIVRLREDLKFRRNIETGLLEVTRRMYRGVGDGEQGYLGVDTDLKSYRDLIRQQIDEILTNGEAAPLEPLSAAYRALFPRTAVQLALAA